MKSVRTSTIWRSLIYQGSDQIFESGKQERRKGGRAFETRSVPALARSPRRPLPSISEIPFLVSLFESAQSAELFLLFVSSAKSRGYFGEAAETFTRAACAPQIRGIRVIRGLPSRPKHSCPFVVSPPKIFLEPRRRDQYKRPQCAAFHGRKRNSDHGFHGSHGCTDSERISEIYENYPERNNHCSTPSCRASVSDAGDL